MDQETLFRFIKGEYLGTGIDRRSLCSGRIHYKITLKVCLQDGQVLSLI